MELTYTARQTALVELLVDTFPEVNNRMELWQPWQDIEHPLHSDTALVPHYFPVWHHSVAMYDLIQDTRMNMMAGCTYSPERLHQIQDQNEALFYLS
jgi:hypothetical protein